ncbi:MAG: acyl carrier protein [Bauldia sp.]|nr:acyl carrier protein [Bauldia sp.]
MDHDAKKLRGARHRGQAGEQARPATTMRQRTEPADVGPEDPGSAALAAVIAEVLPRHDPKNPPAASAELYSDLFIDSRRFLMIIRGLERTLGVEIDDEDLLGVDLITYGDLLRFVAQVVAKQGRTSE